MEFLRRFVPKYFIDKFEETDISQVRALHQDLRQTLIYGTTEEREKAMDDVRTRERLQKKELLGQAAMQLLNDMRAMYADSQGV